MESTRKFSSQNLKWKCEAVFFDDRLEWSWDEWGLGVSKGKSVVLRDELSPHLTESSSMAVEAKGPLLTGVGYMVLAIFSHVLLPTPWRHIEWLFVFGFLLAGGKGIFRLFRKTESINIQLKNGNPVAAIIVTKWPSEEREAFRSFYGQWVKMPNQSPEPMRACGPHGSS